MCGLHTDTAPLCRRDLFILGFSILGTLGAWLSRDFAHSVLMGDRGRSTECKFHTAAERLLSPRSHTAWRGKPFSCPYSEAGGLGPRGTGCSRTLGARTLQKMEAPVSPGPCHPRNSHHLFGPLWPFLSPLSSPAQTGFKPPGGDRIPEVEM